MDFRTQLKPYSPHFRLNFRQPLILAGSCFAEEIGLKLTQLKFKTLTNPYGIIFNPITLAWLFSERQIVDFEPYYLQTEAGWQNFLLHSDLYAATKTALEQKISQTLALLKAQLTETECLVFTFGTAFVYKHLRLNVGVANCHRAPSNHFEKTMLSVSEIVGAYSALWESKHFKNKKIILTVSPVRHIKDSLELNSVSKAVLRLAAHELAERFEQVYYFPAFELLNDDLRDYRFYASDMLHPSEMAISYIFEKFLGACFDSESQDFVRQCVAINLALRHKPRHPESTSHKAHLQKLLHDLTREPFQERYSHEVAQIRVQLGL